ncbi:MAG: asparagine synthase-related protein, partial [Methanobacteriaceae archaeon]|nr:asparagine synthase-related protein [Methanobacteriaceae archaeon]
LMYGIIDYEGNLNKEDLSSKFGIELDINNENIDEDMDNENPIGFYLLSDNTVTIDNLIISFDGVIYNSVKLGDLLDKTIEAGDFEYIEKLFENHDDCQLIANLTYYYYKLTDDLLTAISTVESIIDGDYVIVAFDGENLAITRDEIGVKPLFCGFNSENNVKGFSQDKKTLWKLGVKDENIYDLRPGDILYNWGLYENKESIINKALNMDLTNYKEMYGDYNKFLETKEDYEVYKDLIFANLIESVYKRVNGKDKVGLIFSGGVDSSILAVILKEIAIQRMELINEGTDINPLNIKLFAVGLENSQDIKMSRRIADELDLELEEIIINEDIIARYTKDVLYAIEEANIMKLGVGMTMFIASKFMAEEGYDLAISGQGADELFGGYNRYLKHFENNTLSDAYFDLDSEIRHDIENMYHVNLERDYAVCAINGVELRLPFLDKNLVNLAMNCPANYKIKDSEDILRKHILRDVAREFGLPDYICDRPKKAAQYGSGINKILKKKVLKGF